MPRFFTPPATAPDPRQLDLPFFDEPAPRASSAPDPALHAPDTPLAPSSPPPFSLMPSPATSALPEGVTQRSLAFGVRRLYYRLKRSSRRSIGFVIDGNGLTVTAPRWVTLTDIETAIVEKERWIFAKLAEWQTRVEQRALPCIVWQDGVRVPYLGQPVRVSLGATQLAFHANESGAQNVLMLPLLPQASAQQIQDRVQGWLQSEAKRIFGERLSLYAEKLGVRFQSYALSSAATRWGSCSSDRRIRLNWRLIHFPLPVIDYVVAHELAHLHEMNHSPRFWQTVESIFPEFREARKALRGRDVEIR